MGHLAQSNDIVDKEAERLGYDTLWVGNRLMHPVNLVAPSLTICYRGTIPTKGVNPPC
ncbi:MAG TPA: hypothetical protein VGK77_02540 [Candidatus Binatia bacterium]|jgi:hypothetical protein